jgi:hypothetical protein
MDVDWIVAIMVFLIFVGWGFSYYLTFFPEAGTGLEYAADSDSGKIMDFLSTDVYSVPVRLNAGAKDNAVLKARLGWYGGTKNSTRVFQNSVSLPCRIAGDDLYWLANLSSGWNHFDVEFSDTDTSLNCDSDFSLVNVTQTIPWVGEKRTLVSMSRINGMTGTVYEDFREGLGIGEDFNLTLEWNGGSETYGKPLPGNRDVHARQFESLVWESPEDINISVRVW